MMGDAARWVGGRRKETSGVADMMGREEQKEVGIHLGFEGRVERERFIMMGSSLYPPKGPLRHGILGSMCPFGGTLRGRLRGCEWMQGCIP